MGVSLHILIGFLLLCVQWKCEAATTESNGTSTDSTVQFDKPERSANLIEQSSKTDSNQKSVFSIQDVVTTTILTPKSEESPQDSKNTEPTVKITKKEKDKNRENNSRSIDIDKYVSPEFQNNEYTLSQYTDTEKYENHFEFKTSSTERPSSEFDMELTTPKSSYFDDKFKEAVQKLEQEFEENHDTAGDDHDGDDDDTEHENARENEEMNENDDGEDEEDETVVERPEEKPKIAPNVTVNNKETKNIFMKNNTRGKGVARNNVVVEKVKKVNYVSNFNDTKAYDWNKKDQTTEVPRGTLPTTRKSTTLTKPPVEQNNSHLLSNKIETETIKAINIATTEVPSSTKAMDKDSFKEASTVREVRSSTEKMSTTTLFDSFIPDTTFDSGETTTFIEGTTWDTTHSFEVPEYTTGFIEHTTLENIAGNITESEITESSEKPTSTESDATTTSKEQSVELTERMIETDTTTHTNNMENIPTTIVEFTTSVEVTTEDRSTTAAATTHSIQDDSDSGHQSSEATSTIVPTTTTVTSQQSSDSAPATVAGVPRFIETNEVTPGETTERELTEASSATERSATPSYTDEINQGRVAAIVISSVGAVCLILLAALLYIIRKRQTRFNYKQRCRPVGLDDYSVDNVSVYNSVRRKGAYRQSKRSYGNPAFDDHEVTTHPLNFPALAKFATNTVDMKAEFDDIPQITAKTSELPEGCETKNRYANVIPLPETRVYLNAIDGQPNSDYINANYVTGHKDIKGFYIACQAPMQNTVDDFWRMIWEQQAKVVLMITHLFENGVEKCVDYLPSSEVVDCHRMFGDYQVTLKKRDVKEKYIISCLQLKNMVSNSWREVTHFWYLGWPDKGVPTEANSLIAFLIEARSYMKTSTLDKNSSASLSSGQPPVEVNPVVVHCSPGTGRTGVVIACDIAIRDFEQTRLVDVPKTVYRIRRDRANAVQTKEQYMFIYKVVSLYATKLTGGALDSI